MSERFSTAMKMQHEIVRAQAAQLGAAQKMLDVGKQIMAVQTATRKAAEANLAAWNQWASLWGCK